MGTKYETESLTGYNSGAPVDDGTVSEANKVKWSSTKDKLADPIKDQVANIDAKLVAMADVGPDAKIANYTTLTGDHEKTLEVTATSVTVTLLAVASAPSGYTVTVKNNSGSTVDVTATGSETIDGSTATVTLADMETLIVQLKQGGAGYISLQQVTLTGGAGLTSVNSFTKTQKWAKGVDIASADDTALLDDGNYNDITGTTTINGMTDGTTGEVRKFHYDGIAILKHDTAPSAGYSKLWLPNSADYTTAANDELEFVYDGTYWRVSDYVLASGLPIVVATQTTAANGSSMVLLDTKTASTSSTIDFTSFIDGTYDNYLIKISGMVPSSNGFDLLMRVSVASTFKSDALYYWGLSQIHQGGANVPLGGTTDTSIKLGDSLPNTAANGLRYDINFSNPDSTALYTTFDGSGSGFQTTNGVSGYTPAGYYLNTAAIDGIRFLMSTGDIASGIFRLYGIKDS